MIFSDSQSLKWYNLIGNVKLIRRIMKQKLADVNQHCFSKRGSIVEMVTGTVRLLKYGNPFWPLVNLKMF